MFIATVIPTSLRKFLPGDKAALTIQAPFGGVAWVLVETDEVLDTLLVPVKGNAGRIELPIKKEYAPNATVSIYLVKPGGDTELPRERFAYSEIEVRRPDRELKIEPHLASATAKPGKMVRGEVSVTSENKPVPDVDLLVFAVDDAVLTLGDWKLPAIGNRFYPRNPFSVRTYEALYWRRWLRSHLKHQKCSERISHARVLAGESENRRRLQSQV